jgi:hypothetical protein
MPTPFVSVVRLVGAGSILIGSFFLTLKILDYLDYAREEQSQADSIFAQVIRPKNWGTSGGASYSVQGDTFVMHGPNYIFTETDCKPSVEAEFSLALQHAGAANIELLFLGPTRIPVSEPAIQDISGVDKKVVDLRAVAPPGTAVVRALIYSPRSDAITFSDPTVRLHLKARP